MLFSRALKMRNLTLIAFAVLLAGAVYGFAAANTVPESGAGDGSGAISGYDVTVVTYNLLASDPSTLDSVSFELAPSVGADDATEVKVKLDASSTSWFNCTGTAPTFTCSIAGAVNVVDADELRVVAAQ